MESRTKILGHPVHPMLVVFPLGLLITSLIFDIICLASGNTLWSYIAEYMIGAGVLGGLLAAIFGALDWLAIPSGTRAKSIGLWHGGSNILVVVLFIIGWFLRLPDPAHPGAAALVLSFVAIAIGGIAGWLGGELVDRLAIGVDDGANPDAPSSLSGPIRGSTSSQRRVA